MSVGSSGHLPGVDSLPLALHDAVEMQVPLVVPTLQVFGAFVVQHYSRLSTIRYSSHIGADTNLNISWIVGTLSFR